MPLDAMAGQPHRPATRAGLPPHRGLSHLSGNGGDCAFWPNQQHSGIEAADGIEPLILIFGASVLMRINDVSGADQQPALGIDVSDS